MADKSQIQWTDATWNPTTGCTKVSPGCANCYIVRTPAFRIPGRKFVKGATDLRLHDDRLDTPLHWRKPRRVFVNSLSDLFHEDVPFPFVAAVFAVMAYCARHTFQVLTKRPERMRAFMEWVNAPDGAVTFIEQYGAKAGQHITMLRMNRVDTDLVNAFHEETADGVGLDACLHNEGVWPPKNIWLGVSVENQHFADERIPLLLQTPAAVRFISAEPLLEDVDLTPHLHGDTLAAPGPSGWVKGPRLDWIIVGGESGPGARPFDLAWVRSILDQCRVLNTPVFVKQLGAMPVGHWSPRVQIADGPFSFSLRDKKGGEMSQWPSDLRVRQFPNSTRLQGETQ